MRKLLSVLAIFWAVSAVAEDSWLYWMLGDTGDYNFTSVKVRGNSDSGDSYLSLYYSAGVPVAGGVSVDAKTVSDINADGVGLYAYLAADKVYSSFIIELWNDSFVAQSETISYAQALAYIETGNGIKLNAAWAPVSYAVPEPNSAILLLIGCAAICLRRRNLQVA